MTKNTLICSTLKIGNKSYSLKPLIGRPFGSLFQIESGDNGQNLACITPSREEGLISCYEFFNELLSSLQNF